MRAEIDDDDQNERVGERCRSILYLRANRLHILSKIKQRTRYHLPAGVSPTWLRYHIWAKAAGQYPDVLEGHAFCDIGLRKFLHRHYQF